MSAGVSTSSRLTPALDRVHRLEVLHVAQEYTHADRVVERAACRPGDGFEVPERLPRLLLERLGLLAGLGAERALPGEKTIPPAATACEYGPEGFGAPSAKIGLFIATSYSV